MKSYRQEGPLKGAPGVAKACKLSSIIVGRLMPFKMNQAIGNPVGDLIEPVSAIILGNKFLF